MDVRPTSSICFVFFLFVCLFVLAFLDDVYGLGVFFWEKCCHVLSCPILSFPAGPLVYFIYVLYGRNTYVVSE